MSKKNKTKEEHRVLIAKRLARRWILSHIRPEHRLIVYYGPYEVSRVPSLLRSFRDGRVKLAGIDIKVPDLGVSERFDCFEIWSSNRDGMIALNEWLEKRGFETSGVW